MQSATILSLKLVGILSTNSIGTDHAVDKIKSVNLAKNFLWPNETI